MKKKGNISIKAKLLGIIIPVVIAIILILVFTAYHVSSGIIESYSKNLLESSVNSQASKIEAWLEENDVIIGISFPRYSMRTLKALEFANNRSAKVITITDSIHSPMNLYSSCNLIADSDMASIVDSLVAPLSVINALVVALCMKKQKEVAGTLTMLEDIWDEYQVYENDEINYIDDSIKVHYAKLGDIDNE